MADAVSTTSPHPDARLFHIFHELEALLAAANSSDERTDDETGALGDQIHALEEEAMRHPIRTAMGLAVYAQIAREMMLAHYVDGEPYHVDQVVLTLFDRVEDFAVQIAA